MTTLTVIPEKVLSNKDVTLICDVCKKEFTGEHKECPYCKKKRDDKERKEREAKEKAEEKELKKRLALEAKKDVVDKIDESEASPSIILSTLEEPLKISTQLKDMIDKYYHGIEAYIRSDANNKQYLLLKAARRNICFPFIDNNCERKYYLDNDNDVKAMKKLYIEDIKKYGAIAIKGLSLFNLSQLEFLLSSQYRQMVYDFEAEKFFEPSAYKGLVKYAIIGVSAILSTAGFIFEMYTYSKRSQCEA